MLAAHFWSDVVIHKFDVATAAFIAPGLDADFECAPVAIIGTRGLFDTGLDVFDVVTVDIGRFALMRLFALKARISGCFGALSGQPGRHAARLVRITHRPTSSVEIINGKNKRSFFQIDLRLAAALDGMG